MGTQTLIVVGLIAAVGVLLFVFGSSDTEVESDFEEDEFGFEEEEEFGDGEEFGGGEEF